jgi:4-diphosphocytidyl-2-C-methyl-D-erythritol kinase
MVCFPNCKINIGLFITARRADGYHNLATVFYPLRPAAPAPLGRRFGAPYTDVLNDVLEVVPTTGEPQLHMSGLAIDGQRESNLVWKAYTMLRNAYPAKVPLLNIYLHKATPMGAGLGGGSADGAWMLRLLNDYCQLGLTDADMAAFALQLGSDCPFFIYNQPAYATSRGEEMTPISLDLSGYDIKVICPGIHVSTRDAFARITPRPAPFDLQGLSTLPVTEWRHYVQNDFEPAVFAMHPQLATIKQEMYDRGAVYASMTGTGSAVYGIFERG